MIISHRRLDAPMMFVGFTALSVEIRTKRLQPFREARCGTTHNAAFRRFWPAAPTSDYPPCHIRRRTGYSVPDGASPRRARRSRTTPRSAAPPASQMWTVRRPRGAVPACPGRAGHGASAPRYPGRGGYRSRRYRRALPYVRCGRNRTARPAFPASMSSRCAELRYPTLPPAPPPPD